MSLHKYRANAIIACLLLAHWTVCAANEKSSEILLPSQPLASALIELGSQLDVSIIFDKAVTADIVCRDLKGRLSAADAFARLLEGTDLEFELLEGQIYSIRRKRAVPPVALAVRLENEPIAASERKDDYFQSDLDSLEEISVQAHYVTGSRIKRTDPTGSAPVDILDPRDLELSGAQSLSNVFKFLPAVAGNSTNTSVSNGGDGTSTVTLRGLPASHTLVLINGKRTTNDGLAGESADLNAIPLAAVDRIEILKDGASAIYGSDAIAGVVNIITKNDYQGFNIDAYYGQTSRGDLNTTNADFTWGHIFDRGSVLIGASYYDQGSILSRDRDISASADDRRKGGVDKRSSATPNPRITIGDATLILRDDGFFDGSQRAHFRTATDEDRYNYREKTTATVPFSHESAFFNAYYDFDDSLSGHVEAAFTQTQAQNILAPVPLFTGFEQQPIIVSADNIFNPFQVDIYDVRRRLLEMGHREQLNHSKAKRLVIGLEDQFGSFTVGVSINANRTDAKERLNEILNATNLIQALGDPTQCQGMQVDGCEPLNLFGPPGSITDRQLDYLRFAERVTGFSQMVSYQVDLVGELWQLPAGYLQFAAGLEYRRESTTKRPDELTAAGLTVGGANFQPTDGSRDIAEVYAEVVIPILENSRWGDDLYVELAARHSSYSDFGVTTNPKVGIRYHPTIGLLIRATYADGFKAPTLNQMYGGTYQSFDLLSDPCSLAENVHILEGCDLQSDPTLIQFLTVKGGNEELQAENSRNFSLGVVWTPMTLDGLELTLDYFSIDQNEVVDSSAQYIVNQNAAWDRFPDRVKRDSNGNIKQVTATRLNIGRRKLSGYDITVNYALPATFLGSFKLALNAARITEYFNQIDPSEPTVNLAGTFSDEASEGQGALPKWKANLGLLWSNGNWDSSFTTHYIDSLSEEVPYTGFERTIENWLIYDTQLNYQTPDLGFKFTLGVDNILDREPPFAAAAFNDSFDARTYELAGRYYYSKVAFSF
jgi:iron complex outermembrane receptor protein|tara:strand:+ start:1097 stop:4093 length:2997 start_codon:yes stop_codon:yes gene_type:complete